MSQTARLTLVSAPAGFGKTTLVGSWVAGQVAAAGARLAWVSLDAGDKDAGTFWTYVLTALDRAAPGTGSGGLTALSSGQPVEVVIGSVVNELSVLPDDVVLVLDDYHLADGPPLQPGLAFLLDRLPPQVRLIITTRADPTLPLARMRARGELVEIRAADLRFTENETSTFLTAATSRELDAGDVTALSHRTEGWIASLQLAALSLRGRDDPSAFIAGFAGDDRHVVDYLVEEVLSQQSDEVCTFLLDTSVLDGLTGTLCDAVTRTGGGAQMLESLDRRNLFVVPLDDQRRWYRYHHLFADVLRARLLAERPGDVTELHRRASRWFDQAGQPDEAVRHALAGGDLDGAADLVEHALPELRRQRREHLLRAWAEQLPDDIVRNRPVLAVGLVSGLMASNDFTDVDRRLRDIEKTLARPATDLVVLDPGELARLPAAVETYRAGLALVAGDLAGAISHADDAQAKSLPDDDLTRAAAAGLAGLAHWAAGDIQEAHAAFTTCATGLERADHIADVLGCSLTLADMELALGRLRAAEATLDRALDLADRHTPKDAVEPGHPLVLRGTADMYVALSRAAWHRNELDQAAELLGRADDLGEAAGLPQHPYRWRVALARLRAAAGDHATALDLLDEAERVYVGDFSPQVHPIHATRARVLLASGDLDAAVDWSRRHDLSADDGLSYLREYEHLTLARVLLAQHQATGAPGQLEAATGLLDRLLHAAETGRRFGTVIEVEVLRARANASGEHADAAAAALEHAVDLAEPDGWVRYIVDAGPELTPLLGHLAAQCPDSTFLNRLVPDATASVAPAPGAQTLIEPLSDRELDVLRLLASELDGPSIARHLVVSLNTVRTHTKHIYTKLDVNSRRAAVSRAHKIGLLSRRPGT
ncbi:helix-turn-helix transcriptional regulator [Nocardioides sp. JQ2195]|nr:helix-turn-helix transcriptional regulator [Nocardioides sp. JQ2195]